MINFAKLYTKCVKYCKMYVSFLYEISGVTYMCYIINNFISLYIIMLIIFLLANNSYKDRRGILLYIVSTLAYNIGYGFMAEASTYDALVIALKIEILSSNYLMFLMLMAYIKIFNFKLNKHLFYLFCTILTFNFICAACLEKNSLYYYDMKVIERNGIYLLQRSRGIAFYLNTILTIILAMGCIECIVKFYKRRNRFGCPSSLLMIFSILVTIILYIIFLLGLTNDYDPIGLIISDTLYVYIGIKYKIYDMDGYTKDYVYNSMNAGVIVIDSGDYILSSNNYAQKLFPNIVNTKVVNLYELVPELKDKIVSNKQTNIDIDGKSYDITTERLEFRKDFFGTAIYLFDTTSKNEIISSLLTSKAQADKANKAKSQFLANISHEIRTPVNAIVGMNEMIINECSEQNIKNYAVSAKKAGDILSGLVNQILDLSKLDANKMKLNLIEHSVISNIHEVESLLYYLAKVKGLDAEVIIDKNIPSIAIGDPVRIKQICINLFSNAVKYTQKGKITMSFIVSSVEGDTAIVEIRVQDTGIGIKEEDRRNVFEAFNRLEDDHNKDIDGIGLGLYITHELVEMMNGTIKFDSKYGCGSVFTVTIPLTIVQQQQLDETAVTMEEEDDELIIPWCRILAVDDNAMNLQIMYNFLKDTHAQMTLVKSGFECLDELDKNDYDLILMDDRMPDMDGVKTLSTIRNMINNENNNIPVIMVTANAVCGYEEKYVNAGFADYLAKPLTKDKLLNSVRDHIECNGLNTKDSIKHYSSVSLYSEKLRCMIDNEQYIASRIMQLYEKKCVTELVDYLYEVKNMFIDAGAESVNLMINRILSEYRYNKTISERTIRQIPKEIKRVSQAGEYFLKHI